MCNTDYSMEKSICQHLLPTKAYHQRTASCKFKTPTTKFNVAPTKPTCKPTLSNEKTVNNNAILIILITIILIHTVKNNYSRVAN